MVVKNEHREREPLFHLVKRADVSSKFSWGIRAGTFAIALVLCFIISACFSKDSIFNVMEAFFTGIFSTTRSRYIVLKDMCIFLLIALAVTPCFKMKYWNIGGEGQILMGALGAAFSIYEFAGKMPNALVVIFSLIFAIALAIFWSIMPAIFKAYWNANETLLTLMMNYIATCAVAFFIKWADPNGMGVLNFRTGYLQQVGPRSFVLGQYLYLFLAAIIVFAFMYIYLKKSKHGYELTVVGESINTARYVGINVKKVIIRTLVLSGVICGIIGFLLVSPINHSIKSDLVLGRGFTGVLIAWIGHLNPGAITLVSFVVSFIQKGSNEISNHYLLGNNYANVLISVFFLLIVASEFFINYKIVGRKKIDEKEVEEKLKHLDPVVSLTQDEDEKVENIEDSSSDRGGI